jgi:putative acetyltransferase
MAALRIEPATAPTEEVRALVEELEAELAAHYPPEQRHGLSLDAIFRPHVRFFVARLDDAPVGCGGVALLDGFAELKRMYVRPDFRGRGVADALIERLIRVAVAEGRSLVRLETGTEQAAAIRFYERSGFAVCPIFAPYSSLPPASVLTSVFMERRVPES